jgi:hypothetical protein
MYAHLLYLHTRTWVCNASFLFFSPSLSSLILFPQSTCKRQHAAPLPPPLPSAHSTNVRRYSCFCTGLEQTPTINISGPNALELLISTFSMSTTYHCFVNSHQEKCFSYFHTRDIPTSCAHLRQSPRMLGVAWDVKYIRSRLDYAWRPIIVDSSSPHT